MNPAPVMSEEVKEKKKTTKTEKLGGVLAGLVALGLIVWLSTEIHLHPIGWFIIFLILVLRIYKMVTGDGGYSSPDDDNPY